MGWKFSQKSTFWFDGFGNCAQNMHVKDLFPKYFQSIHVFRVHISVVTKCVTKLLTLSQWEVFYSVKKLCDTLCDTRNMDPKYMYWLEIFWKRRSFTCMFWVQFSYQNHQIKMLTSVKTFFIPTFISCKANEAKNKKKPNFLASPTKIMVWSIF